MNRKLLPNLILATVLLLSILTGATLAQQPEPLVEEPGALAGDGITPPPSVRQGHGAALQSWAFCGGPNYDSGWVALAQDEAQTLSHNLGGDTDDYVVDMQYRCSSSGVNQRYYGGADFGAEPPAGTTKDDRVGAYWRGLTASSITVYRRPEDIYAPEVRIRIWVDPIPGWDSGWVSLTPGGAATTLTHSLGGDTGDYVVDMQYRNAGSGVNQRYHGGADFGAKAFAGTQEDDRVGLYWRSLTNSTITLFRRDDDSYADDVRLRIWVRPTPTYDSGWVSVDPDQAKTLMHSISGNAQDYVVDMQYRSGGSGVNQRYYGGADFGANPPASMSEDDRVGAYWRSLTSSSITVYRRPEDNYASQVRIRIWRIPKPDYDSGWVSLGAGAATTLSHSLGGDYWDYLVDMQYRSAGSGVNQRDYGGADFGVQPPSGMNEDDRVGAYWRGLDSSAITVYRRPEDIYASYVRIRIWRTARPDYESGWQVVGQDVAETWSHNLGGNADSYLVNMIYYDEEFNYINQRHLGGADFGAIPPSGYSADDRVGAYWRSLTDSSIGVYRRPEDGFVDYLRVRIWVTPYRIFLPLVARD
jgi:hypothetical protein